ncbi:MAG TPA: SDR family oxidoreductase, partial [Clostridia bacterium]|nr:SDR family oxidoreductase [Clostridia bacterium]
TAAYCHCDVCSPADIKQLVKYTAETFGDIDILVNNAGGGGLPLHFEEISDGLWEKIVHLNLTASFHTIREVFPYMKAKRSGKIVNISSGYGVTGGEYCAHYASAKAGLIGLTMSVAREVGEYHINCNCIATPTTDTPGLRESDFEFVPEEIPFIPMGRIAMPEDIANCVLYLVSDAADYMTGQIVAPNGGRRMPI